MFSWLCFLGFILLSPFSPFSPVKVVWLPGSCHRDCRALICTFVLVSLCKGTPAPPWLGWLPQLPQPTHQLFLLPAMSRQPCRLVRCVPLSWDGQLCYFILLQAYSKSHWSVHNSGGHWISIYFCLWAAEDPAQIRAVRGPVPVNDGVLWILACLGWQTGEMQLDKERVRKFTALSPSISLLLCSYHNIGPLITGDTKDERELLLAMCCIRQKI